MNIKFLFLKTEFLYLIRQDKNIGIVIYASGLPFVSYIVNWFTESSDSALGLSLLSICFLNIFYAPKQFVVDQLYYEGFFSKGLNFRTLIWAKLFLLQIANLIFYLLLLPQFLVSLNLEEILLLSTFCIYSVGFASPISLWLSAQNFKYNFNSFNTNSLLDMRYKVTLSHLFRGILPFLPEVGIIVLFSSMSKYILILNISLALIGLLFLSKIINSANKMILSNRHML